MCACDYDKYTHEIENHIYIVSKYYPKINTNIGFLKAKCKKVKEYFINYFDKKVQVISDMLNLIGDMSLFNGSTNKVNECRQWIYQQIQSINFLKQTQDIQNRIKTGKSIDSINFDRLVKKFVEDYKKSPSIELEKNTVYCKILKQTKEDKSKQSGAFSRTKPSDLESQIDELKREKEYLQNKYSALVKQKDETITELTETNEKIIEQIASHEKNCSKVIKDFEEIDQKFIIEKQRQRKEFEQKLKEIKLQNEQDTEQIVSETKKLQNEVISLKENIETKKKECNNLNQQLDGLKKQLYDYLMMQNSPKGVTFKDKLEPNTEYFIVLTSNINENKVSLPRVNQCMLGANLEVELYQHDLQRYGSGNQFTIKEQGSQLSQEKRCDIQIKIIKSPEDEKEEDKEEEVTECTDNYLKHQLIQQIVEIPLNIFLTGGTIEVAIANNSLIVPIPVGESEGFSLSYNSVSMDNDGNIIDVVLKTKYLEDPHYQRVGDDLIGFFQYSQENAGAMAPVPYIIEGQSLGEFVLQPGKFRYQGYGFASPTGTRGDYWLHIELI
ncbi:hypothetical protein, conserved [Entamoeba dispar SAW760]|uniref:Uncharacterized protein n=1 Tax=Entamoeba dispar (strain ATCC PRA-260 / SAW760) TaxID=370354 RepID=B0E9Z9_ENTDS|nr:uncharacterized protein EDI_311810 [Entamoeba dispar SAW760]EDR28648.1 hypothetical protein, conserved [Entamoeba dispar SAW760]|eukprot:EDR28648.1 hypothetical protein, conserved [Entamoeba dispar SAW760]